MAKTMVNLTVPVIIEEIENVLETEPYCSCQQAFEKMDLRQELIGYTLSRVRSRYRMIDEGDKPSSFFNSLPTTLEERLQIEAVVRQGIQHLLHTNGDQTNHSSFQIGSKSCLVPCS
ncbi:MAG: hypothetical protein HC865_04850 [Cyanobacteria bacterium RU_5_0]|nr:hypothetical protein [Cyanobacteria bacterium RU_5_0]